jgi:hypothetical protein
VTRQGNCATLTFVHLALVSLLLLGSIIYHATASFVSIVYRGNGSRLRFSSPRQLRPSGTAHHPPATYGRGGATLTTTVPPPQASMSSTATTLPCAPGCVALCRRCQLESKIPTTPLL